MTLPDSFWSKVKKTESCWLWTGATQSSGYGSFGIGGRAYSTHRLAYEDAREPIPDGMQIDHLCRNKRCCNPGHLEVVTAAENNRRARAHRGYYIGGECGFGHKLSGDNLRIHPRGNLVCRTCARRHKRTWNATREKGKTPAWVIREWAAENGIEVSPRGRLSPRVREMYEDAQSLRTAA